MTNKINEIKTYKINALNDYKSCEGVNSFYINDDLKWINHDTRISLRNSINVEKIIGRENTVIWIDEDRYELSIDQALDMLNTIEVYAKDCFDIIETHKLTIIELDNPDKVWNYNYTKGYPKRLIFNL